MIKRNGQQLLVIIFEISLLTMTNYWAYVLLWLTTMWIVLLVYLMLSLFQPWCRDADDSEKNVPSWRDITILSYQYKIYIFSRMFLEYCFTNVYYDFRNKIFKIWLFHNCCILVNGFLLNHIPSVFLLEANDSYSMQVDHWGMYMFILMKWTLCLC